MRNVSAFAVVCALVATVAACSGGVTSLPASTNAAPAATSHQAAVSGHPTEVPASFRCLPSLLPVAQTMRPSLAYMANCAVKSAREAPALEKLAVALMADHSYGFTEYCTGTPISYDPNTHVGFIVTAAHCVVGGAKSPDAPVHPDNITTFSGGQDWIYQGPRGIVANTSELSGRIQAVYVPQQYCRVPAFSNGGCGNLTRQNGDVAVLKVTALNRHIRVDGNLRLAPANAVLPQTAEIMALGYGTNTSTTPDDRVLYYITYHYYANDKFDGVPSELSLMNGYHANGNFYSIICQGDSGGGDFYWDGTHWNLVGAHSWGPVPCGVWGAKYISAYDVSADVRAFDTWVETIVRDDVNPRGCASLSSHYVCRAAG